MKRRHFLATAAIPLAACGDHREIAGSFSGASAERGHLLRDTASWPAPSVTRRTRVVIAGGGVAGLAAARALRMQGMQDFVLLELEDSAGGNARGTKVGGLDCPLGAHYLPVPASGATDLQDLLEEFGLRRRVSGRWQYDERHLCHSPQERLFIDGAWQDGLLPVRGISAATLAQYRRFEQLVEQARANARWTIPVEIERLNPMQRSLAALTFATFLGQNGLDDAHLRWYLDYCCRDDYGAGSGTVSAWAGLHYFASRHGFRAPGSVGAEQRERAERGAGGDGEGLLTWPEGNAWLTSRLAAPLHERLLTGRSVVRIATTRIGVEVDAFNHSNRQVERWQAERAIVALPMHIAARVVEAAPDSLAQAAQRVVQAPWLVANLHIKQALHDRTGPAPSWDNVIYGDASCAPGLGYVDAMHQSLQSVPGATVLTYYRALCDAMGGMPAGALAGRRALIERPWAQWRDEILTELSAAHADLPSKVTHIDISRYGHAMAVPVPSATGQVGYHAQPMRRLRFAHSDWSGYSVFEEAFAQGHKAGLARS
jgi:predicted NAD/FAD-dependent oxidoreductase